LKLRHWVEASRYPFVTMLGQSLGSVVLAFEALTHLAPHVYIDTMGYSWTFPMFYHFAQSYIASYVHYPTISIDMTSNIVRRRATFNNTGDIASSAIKTKLKILYVLQLPSLIR
jgi:alpha-1,2-mannosyltransferase